MGFWDRLFSPRESRSVSDWYALLERIGDDALENVSVNQALRVSAVYACVDLLSDTLAGLPLHLYRKTGDGRERVDDHPSAKAMQDPSTRMSEFDMRKTLVAQRLLQGNGFGWPRMTTQGVFTGMEPVESWRVQVYKTDASLLYKWTDDEGIAHEAVASRFFHMRGLSGTGLVGYSVIGHVMHDVVALAYAQQKSARHLMANGTRLSGVLSVQTPLKKEAIDKLRAAWKALYSGTSRTGETAVLDNGAKFEPVSIPPAEAQFLQQREFSVIEIARMFRVPPHLIGVKGQSSYASAEQNSLEYVQYTILPLVRSFDAALGRALLTPREREQGLYWRHNIAGLLRGDAKSQAEMFAIGVQNGWFNRNEVREMLDLNRVDGLDEYLAPTNMTTAQALAVIAEKAIKDEEPKQPTGDEAAPTPTKGNSQQEQGRKWTPAELRGLVADRVVDAEIRSDWGIDAIEHRDDPAEGQEDDDPDDVTLTESQKAVRRERQEIAQSVVEVWEDAAQRLVKREITDLRRKLRSTGMTKVEFGEWLAEFYANLRKVVRGYFRAPLRTTARLALKSVNAEIESSVRLSELEEYLDEYLAKLAGAWTGSSEGQLRALLTIPDATSEEEIGPLEACAERIDQWEQRRAEKTGRQEAYNATNGASLATMAAGGIAAIVWLARGKSCPFCRSLNGKRVAIGSSFTDGVVSADGQDMKVYGIKQHAPLHGGCDCTLGAAR